MPDEPCGYALCRMFRHVSSEATNMMQTWFSNSAHLINFPTRMDMKMTTFHAVGCLQRRISTTNFWLNYYDSMLLEFNFFIERRFLPKVTPRNWANEQTTEAELRRLPTPVIKSNVFLLAQSLTVSCVILLRLSSQGTHSIVNSCASDFWKTQPDAAQQLMSILERSSSMETTLQFAGFWSCTWEMRRIRSIMMRDFETCITYLMLVVWSNLTLQHFCTI